ISLTPGSAVSVICILGFLAPTPNGLNQCPRKANFLNIESRIDAQRPRFCKGHHFSKRFTGMRRRADEPAAIAAISHDKLIDDVFDLLAVVSDDANENNSIPDTCLYKIAQCRRFPARSVEGESLCVTHLNFLKTVPQLAAARVAVPVWPDAITQLLCRARL
ncbi:MAG TPA: hypothetical protein VK432_11610, partial [Stellaceae bacterium]|nr:hypothetical protein [Stellaceae bacterium]